MRIVDIINKASVGIGVTAENKMDAIDKLVDLQVAGGNIIDREEYKKAILAREETGSTAVGGGIATPHAKSDAVKAASLAVMTVPQGVDYDSFDGEPANILFMIAAPNDGGETHLDVLARLMTLLLDEDLCKAILAAKTADELLDAIDKAEKAKFEEEKPAPASADGYKVLAVTACPTGIAHTYMAAEALEKAGAKLGITIKVETNGSGGAKNILTKEEIAACDGIIVAADKAVEMSRFDGKPVYATKVSDGIKIPEELINKIEKGEAPIYHHTGEKAQESTGNESFGRKLYKQLMNGVSNMLPFTVAGGIFIALAFLIDTICGVSGGSDFGTVTPVAHFLKAIGGYAFAFMLPVLGAFIGKSIADRPGFLVGLVAGYLAANGISFAHLSDGAGIPSGFLGALLGGFVGGYLMLGVERLCDKMPKSLNGIKPVLIYPLAGLAIIALFMCAINPIMGVINTALANFLKNLGTTNRVLLGIVLGAMMSIDMGGPFNKAAYVFGCAAIESQNYDYMAAVMIGGMVPPIAIALSTTFFKNRWTDAERQSGALNYVMGLSFITEGAIPFAAADPGRVIPSCMIGAGVAGGLSMLFGCELMAPHGGIFVFPAVTGWPQYLLALVVGSVVSCLILSLWKKKIR